ncbi:MAG: hypothetical protein L6461_16270 [Anaerolineae bacterium]|nr:hypothetical protein [Anaerolineae bacterium]
MFPKYSPNKLLRLASLGIWGFVLLLILETIITNVSIQFEYRYHPLITQFYLLTAICLGICFLIIGILYTYYSWTLDDQDFMEWQIAQQISKKGKTRKKYNPRFSHRAFRLVGPFEFIIGIVIIIFGLLA